MWRVTRKAIETTRAQHAPAALIFTNVPRRFGHAATDRQAAYLSQEEMNAMEDSNPLAAACAAAVHAGVCTFDDLLNELEELSHVRKFGGRSRAICHMASLVIATYEITQLLGFANTHPRETMRPRNHATTQGRNGSLCAGRCRAKDKHA